MKMKQLSFQALLDFDVSDEEYQRALNRRNKVEGREGIDCPLCDNHEYTWIVHGNNRETKPCICANKRNSIARIRKSGLLEQIKRCTFSSFQTPEKWQEIVKETVMKYVSDENRRWLLVSGQSGCGKSHICTAACNEFLQAGAEVRYMRWIDESILLKASINSDVDYNKYMNPLKNCQVLYIDDFWKTQQGQQPSPADVRLAFDLLDFRYCNRSLTTIISTERTVSDLLDIDMAVGGRIYEMTKGYCLEIGGNNKNWRLRDLRGAI